MSTARAIEQGPQGLEWIGHWRNRVSVEGGVLPSSPLPTGERYRVRVFDYKYGDEIEVSYWATAEAAAARWDALVDAYRLIEEGY